MLDRNNLHDYQVVAGKHVYENPYSALFMDMGLGKTISILTILHRLICEDLEIEKVLVIAPKRVVDSVWTQEAKKWKHTKNFKIVKVAGTPKKRMEALNQQADIYLLGRDNVAWLCGLYGGLMLPFDMLVIDESSSFKNPKSIRFKALRKVRTSFKRIVLLTGTPAPKGLIDLWAQLFLLDGGERLGKFVTEYRRKYFKPNQRNGHTVFNYKLLKQSEEKIYSKIEDICISMNAKELGLQLPELVVNPIQIKFDSRLQEQYNEFEKNSVLELFEDVENMDAGIFALNAAALSNKLLQFANGAIYDADKNWHEVHKLKLEETKQIIESNEGKPVLIGWTYRHDMERLLKYLKAYKPVQLKTDQDVVNWNAGKIQVLMMHPASGGHGLNLQAGGNNIVWFGQTWDLELYQQMNARLYRQGQAQTTFIRKLIAVDTIDTRVVAAQESKADKQNSLLIAVRKIINKTLTL